MSKPKFRSDHLKARAEIMREQSGQTTTDASDASGAPPHTLTTGGSDANAKSLDDVDKDRSTFREKGYYEVYTDENYSSAVENRGRTWQQDDRKLIPKRMQDGQIKNLIFVWNGPTDRWTCSREEIADIERRTGILNSGMASADDIDMAAATAEPALLPCLPTWNGRR